MGRSVGIAARKNIGVGIERELLEPWSVDMDSTAAGRSVRPGTVLHRRLDSASTRCRAGIVLIPLRVTASAQARASTGSGHLQPGCACSRS
jgi:hypothetical protein